MTNATLQGEQAKRAAAAKANPSAQDAKADSELAGKLSASNARVTVLKAQLDDLNKEAANPATPPALAGDKPESATPMKDQLLKDAMSKLLTATAGSFDRPRLHATQVLDNFVQMQYEIVAKQLTALRDEVVEGSRIVFLELPTSISPAGKRFWDGGGANRLAQSWWKVTEIDRAYDTATSPCWVGGEYDFGEVQKRQAQPREYDKGGSVDAAQRARLDRLKMLLVGLKQARGGERAKQEAFDTAERQGFKAEREKQTFSKLAQQVSDLTAQNPAQDRSRQLQSMQNSLRSIRQAQSQDESKFRNDLDAAAQSVEGKRREVVQLEQEILAAIQPVNRKDYDTSETQTEIATLESPCKAARIEFAEWEKGIRAKKKEVERKLRAEQIKGNSQSVIDELAAQIGQFDKELERGRAALREDLEARRMEIYAAFGGPEQMRRIFYTSVRHPGDATGPVSDSGIVRALEVIPRQTALNVNETHALVRNTALSFAFRYVFGLGGKVDYQTQREKYDQFVQQEVFASGFGKGDSTFGWTFGPTPGTHLLNAGTRNTYAVLVVPDNATALHLKANGCSFGIKKNPPENFPADREGDIECGTPFTAEVRLPGREDSGSFDITGVSFTKIKAGQRASIVLQGNYISPQTTVLVNGKRLTQLVGLGKPPQTMDNGPAEDGETNAISGNFEFVNHQYLAISLTVPPNYSEPKFPSITLIAPSKTRAINDLPLLINGVYGKHLDEADENLLEDEPKKLALRSVQIVSIAPDSIVAHIQGDQLSTVDRVLVNGGPVSSSSAPVDDTVYKVGFSPPGAPEWEFLAVTGEVNPAKRKSSAVIIPNPLTLAITQAQIQQDAAEFDGATATSIPVVLVGSGFRPGLRLQTTKPGSVRTSAYISPTRWFCTVANPSALFYVTLSDPGNPAYIASIEVNRPKPAEAKEDSADSTITEVQTKKIVTHKP